MIRAPRIQHLTYLIDIALVHGLTADNMTALGAPAGKEGDREGAKGAVDAAFGGSDTEGLGMSVVKKDGGLVAVSADAGPRVEAGDVTVNFKQVKSSSASLKTGDVVMAKNIGRLDIVEIGETRKGKVRATVIKTV